MRLFLSSLFGLFCFLSLAMESHNVSTAFPFVSTEIPQVPTASPEVATASSQVSTASPQLSTASKNHTSTPDSNSSSNRFVVVHAVLITGNEITKDRIILRELPFHAGDTIAYNQLNTLFNRAHNNVLNTSLFNFVSIDTLTLFSKSVDILISVKERWYILPAPLFMISERNFNTWLQNPNLYRASYGFYLTDNNFRGLKQNLTFGAQFGYTNQYSLNYFIPFIDKNQNNGIGFGVSYTRSHEVYYETQNDQLQYYRDDNQVLRQQLLGRITYNYRSGLYNTHAAEFRFVKSTVVDTIVALNSNYFGGGATQFQAFIASYGFKRDYRDSKIYPLVGYYLSIDFVKQGLGILKDESVNLFYIMASARKYWALSNRLFFGTMFKLKYSENNQPPYYVQRALGYNNDYVRGYELSVIDGQSFGLLKTNLRYQLIRPHILHLQQIPSEKFNTIPYSIYLSLFADGAYVIDNFYKANNPLTNSFLMGQGIGIDFVSYYDAVVRFEYSWTMTGTSGWFLHFAAPF